MINGNKLTLSSLCVISYLSYAFFFIDLHRGSNPAFVNALTMLEKAEICHSLTLSSFLLLPMQRITRMPLLLDAILTKLTSDHPEYIACQSALAQLNKVIGINYSVKWIICNMP